MAKYSANRIVGQESTNLYRINTMQPKLPIKDFVRCPRPGLKRLVQSFKKKRNCAVFLLDEYKTSSMRKMLQSI